MRACVLAGGLVVLLCVVSFGTVSAQELDPPPTPGEWIMPTPVAHYEGWIIRKCVKDTTGGEWACVNMAIGASMGGSVLMDYSCQHHWCIFMLVPPKWAGSYQYHYETRGHYPPTLPIYQDYTASFTVTGGGFYGDGYIGSYPEGTNKCGDGTYSCWSPFRASAFAHQGPMSWCLYPEITWPLVYDAHFAGGLQTFQVVNLFDAVEVILTLDSVSMSACYTPEPTLTPTYAPIGVATPTPTVIPAYGTALPYPTYMPYPTQLPYPPFPTFPPIELTVQPYPTALPSPTPVIVPPIIDPHPHNSCYSLLPTFGLHQKVLGRDVDFDFPGFQLCVAEYGVSFDLVGIPITAVFSAALIFGLAVAAYHALK